MTGSYINIFSCHDGSLGSCVGGAAFTALVMWSMRFDCVLVTDGASDISASSSSDRQTSTAGGDEDRISGEEASSDPSEAESGISITSAATARGRGTFGRLVGVAAANASSAFAAFLVP